VVLEHGQKQIEIARASIAQLRAWRFPVPETGLDIVLHSGRVLRLGIAAPRELAPLIEHDELCKTLGSGRWMQFAVARSERATHPWVHRSLKFIAWPSLFALVLFRAHQYITYGGPFGQYYLVGLAPYLGSLARTWLDVAVHLLLFAALLRTLAELGAWSLTLAWPTRCRSIRRVAELAASSTYYLGAVAVFLGPFLA
jgi:hypothetical protein